MPAEPSPPLDKLSVLALSGAFERVHYALVLASGAAAIGLPVTLFFTHGALLALRAPSPVDGAAGWRSMPTLDARTAGEVDDDWAARGVASFAELLDACVACGVRFIACEMGLRVLGLPANALSPDLPIEVAGVVTLLHDASARGSLLVV